MKEIKQLFHKTEVTEIKQSLEQIIAKIENTRREEQNKILEELVQEARKKDKQLKEKTKIKENLHYYNPNISPIGLLAEEITQDSYIEKDMLKVTKFNLNNYYNQFKEQQKGDWSLETEEIAKAITVLETECEFFTALKEKGVNVSIFYFNQRYRKQVANIINYDLTKNQNFAIHIYSCENHPKEDEFKIFLEQCGLLLKGALVGESQRAPEGFIKIYENIEIEPIDEESKELTSLFADTFAHYIIEKMEMRITQEIGEGWKEETPERDETFVKRMLDYFDNIFNKLLEQREELEDNAFCPCGSGKKYKNCCKKKKIKFYKTEKENKITKSIPMHPEVEKAMRSEKIRFKKLFGRAPGDHDYVAGGVLLKDFHRINKILKREGRIDKAWLYASDRTGIMLNLANEDYVSDRDINEFKKYMEEYQKIMKSKIKNNTCNELQAIEGVSFIIDSLINNKIEDMIYVLNLFVNSYSKEKQSNKEFSIQNIKDFLVFCAYKTSINLDVLEELVNGEYYDNAMGVVRNIYEILISVRAYKNDADLFNKKIISLAGLDLGTHEKIDGTYQVKEIKTGKIYKYRIQKKELAKRAGNEFLELYNNLYNELSSFIHVDAVAAKNIFKENDLFDDIDECLIAGFIGMTFCLEIIIELTDFEGCDERISKDIKYFSNKLLKDFLPIINTIITIDDREVYRLIETTLKSYKTNYEINYKRGYRSETY